MYCFDKPSTFSPSEHSEVIKRRCEMLVVNSFSLCEIADILKKKKENLVSMVYELLSKFRALYSPPLYRFLVVMN